MHFVFREWREAKPRPAAGGYSGSPIAILRKHTAEWLFPQEKATFDSASKGTRIGEPLYRSPQLSLLRNASKKPPSLIPTRLTV
jgi:hypothetical protein